MVVSNPKGVGSRKIGWEKEEGFEYNVLIVLKICIVLFVTTEGYWV